MADPIFVQIDNVERPATPAEVEQIDEIRAGTVVE